MHGFGPWGCHVGSACVGGIGEQSVEKGAGLGRGEDGWCGVRGVGVLDCHDERMEMRWEA